MRASSLASEADGLLLLDGITSLEHLNHLALEGSKSGNLLHDFSDGLNAGVLTALAARLVLLESVCGLLGLGHDVSLVQTDKNSTLLHHLISFKIIMHKRRIPPHPCFQALHPRHFKFPIHTHGVLGFWGFGVLVAF